MLLSKARRRRNALIGGIRKTPSRAAWRQSEHGTSRECAVDAQVCGVRVNPMEWSKKSTIHRTPCRRTGPFAVIVHAPTKPHGRGKGAQLPSYQQIFSERARRDARRAEFSKLLEDFATSDPEYLSEIAAVLQNGAPPREGVSGRYARAGRPVRIDDEAFNLVKAVLDSRENQWTETSQLRDGSGLSKAKLFYVLRKTHAQRFEKRQHPQHGKKLEWRLVSLF